VTMRPLLLLLFVVAAACSKPQDGGSLSERVQFSCENLAADLRRASDEYKEYAGWIESKRLSPEQQGRAEGKLPYGATDRERAVAVRALYFELFLCARSRKLDEPATEQLTIRASELTQEFMNPEPAEMARSIEALAALAAEIKNVPVRE
jgi:hypothetical protein